MCRRWHTLGPASALLMRGLGARRGTLAALPIVVRGHENFRCDNCARAQRAVVYYVHVMCLNANVLSISAKCDDRVAKQRFSVSEKEASRSSAIAYARHVDRVPQR